MVIMALPGRGTNARVIRPEALIAENSGCAEILHHFLNGKVQVYYLKALLLDII